MRKTLLSLTALAALLGAGVATEATAAPSRIEGATVQTVQYYGGRHEGYRHEERRREHWRHWHHRHYRGW